MLAQTPTGIVILKDYDWKVHMLSQGNNESNQFITLPSNVEDLFNISVPP